MFISKNGNYRKSIVRRLELLFPEDEEALPCEEDVEVPLLRKSSVWREELRPEEVEALEVLLCGLVVEVVVEELLFELE